MSHGGEMSEWAYRKCKICGSRVHINFMCGNGCKGDPWGVIDGCETDLARCKEVRESLLGELSVADDMISFYENKLNNLRIMQTADKTDRQKE